MYLGGITCLLPLPTSSSRSPRNIRAKYEWKDLSASCLSCNSWAKSRFNLPSVCWNCQERDETDNGFLINVHSNDNIRYRVLYPSWASLVVWINFFCKSKYVWPVWSKVSTKTTGCVAFPFNWIERSTHWYTEVSIKKWQGFQMCKSEPYDNCGNIPGKTKLYKQIRSK